MIKAHGFVCLVKITRRSTNVQFKKRIPSHWAVPLPPGLERGCTETAILFTYTNTPGPKWTPFVMYSVTTVTKLVTTNSPQLCTGPAPTALDSCHLVHRSSCLTLHSLNAEIRTCTERMLTFKSAFWSRRTPGLLTVQLQDTHILCTFRGIWESVSCRRIRTQAFSQR